MRDRDLVRLYWPAELRPAFDALFAIDDAMGDVVVRATEPTLAAIKLAWWRESLERLDHEPPPAEPRLRAAAEQLLPRGITGKELAALEPGWTTLLDERPSGELIAARGGTLFQSGARLLRISASGLGEAGALFATVDVARRSRKIGGLGAADELRGLSFPWRARPLTALAALASRDMHRTARVGWEPEATPGRAWALIRHRLTGRMH